MSKKIFNILSLIGLIIIIILSFIIPNNPFNIFSSYTFITFDRPLWLNCLIVYSFIYLLITYKIYNIIFN